MFHSKTALVWVTLALILYLFLSLTYLSLPGLQYDETNFVNAAIGRDNSSFIAYEKKIFGRKIPLMILSYIGALKSGLFAPIFHYFGRSAATVRFPVVCVGLATLLVSYALYRRLFDRKVAAAGVLLFSADPTFVFANKLDWGPVSLMLLLEVSTFYFMWRWIKEEKRVFLVLAGFLFGLGLYNKIVFAWYFSAFFLSLAIFYRDIFKKLFHSQNLVRFVPAFILGCLPLIAYNIHVRMAMFKRGAILTSLGSEFLRNRYELFRGTLDGFGTYFLFNQAEVAMHPAAFPNTEAPGSVDYFIAAVAGFTRVGRSILPLALIFSLFLILAFWAFKRLDDKRHILFVASQLLIMGLLISITAEANGAHHVIAIYPFVFAVIAFAFSELGLWLTNARARLSAVVTGLCLVLVLVTQLVVDARHLHSFRSLGGSGYWSKAIYDLAAFVRSNAGNQFVLMDWGFATQLSLLADDNSRLEEFVCDPPSDLDGCITPLLNQADALLLFHAPPYGDDALINAYRNAASRSHLFPHVKKSFLQGDGRPIYVVYETLHADRASLLRDLYIRREAEQFDSKKGGSIDIKAGASGKSALGNFWGIDQGDFASYQFTLPGNIAEARIRLRYAFADQAPQAYYLFMDGQYQSVLTLQSTHGFGVTEKEWQIADAKLGYLPQGKHELTIKPMRNRQIINLDYFVIQNSNPQ